MGAHTARQDGQLAAIAGRGVLVAAAATAVAGAGSSMAFAADLSPVAEARMSDDLESPSMSQFSDNDLPTVSSMTPSGSSIAGVPLG